MRESIYTIPVSEVFEINDGCPICRMKKISEERILDYILGDAMMEPDVRIETNKTGFCNEHYNDMLGRRGRLQLALMLQTHIDEINKTVYNKPQKVKKNEHLHLYSEDCFICDKLEWGMSRMLKTVIRCYETDADFRRLFNNQPMFCLDHYQILMSYADKKNMKHFHKEFAENLKRITKDYSERLYKQLSDYCAKYDYRSRMNGESTDGLENSVEDTVKFLG